MQIEMLCAQLSFYKEDFNRERKDRIALEAKLQVRIICFVTETGLDFTIIEVVILFYCYGS